VEDAAPAGEHEQSLRTTLTLVMQHRPREVAALWDGHSSTWHQALAAFGLTLSHDWEGGHRAALQAVDSADDPTGDPEGRALARAVAAFSSSGVVDGPGPYVHLAGVADELDALAALPPALRQFVGHLWVEAALANNRMRLAGELADRVGIPDGFLSDGATSHPYLAIMEATQARVLAWLGDIAGAQAFLDSRAAPGSEQGRWLLDACRCLLLGHAADGREVTRLADELAERPPVAVDHVSGGCHLLVAFGLLALGDTARAARSILTAGGGAELTWLKVVDRGLGWVVLASLAAAEGDLESAQSWAAQSRSLLHSPIAHAAASRIQGLVANLGGRHAEAASWARLAVLQAAWADGGLELNRGELLLSAIEIAGSASGAAQRRLDAVVARTEGTGQESVRRAASRELRKVGRRLMPRAGAGWDALSPREQSVAVLLAQGHANQEIADELVLSPHTVRVHVSRVLAAYGLAARTTLPTLLAEHLSERPVTRPLTRRQREVADLIAAGASNVEIGTRLGITESAVEKHVTAIRRVWGVRSRAAIVAQVTRLRAD